MNFLIVLENGYKFTTSLSKLKGDIMTKYNKEELKNILSEEAYHVTQENGTEMPFSLEKKIRRI